MSAVFVTATGTDIGKTFVAAGLIRHLRAAGRKVDALKPVVTGFDDATAAASDPGVLCAALGRPVARAEIERIAPFRFAAPFAPDLAARRENRTLDFDALLEFSRRAANGNDGTLLIEGVGGIMVPLDANHTVLDWMIALHLPLILVTGSYLGSISHTLTCLEVLRHTGLRLKALVISETPGSTVPMHDTAETLTRFTQTIPVLALPRLPAGQTTHPVFGEIAALL
jgi:dethiobiotin synthetase